MFLLCLVPSLATHLLFQSAMMTSVEYTLYQWKPSFPTVYSNSIFNYFVLYSVMLLVLYSYNIKLISIIYCGNVFLRVHTCFRHWYISYSFNPVSHPSNLQLFIMLWSNKTSCKPHYTLPRVNMLLPLSLGKSVCLSSSQKYWMLMATSLILSPISDRHHNCTSFVPRYWCLLYRIVRYKKLLLTIWKYKKIIVK